MTTATDCHPCAQHGRQTPAAADGYWVLDQDHPLGPQRTDARLPVCARCQQAALRHIVLALEGLEDVLQSTQAYHPFPLLSGPDIARRLGIEAIYRRLG